jgi:hypothetical protein
MKLLGKRTVLIAAAAIALACGNSARAEHHATNFLDALEQEVDTRLENTEAELTRSQRSALRSAARTLDRTSTTLAGDARLLSSAAATLGSRFRDSEDPLATLPETTLESFLAEANAQLDDITARIGTNTVRSNIRSAVRSGSNSLLRAESSRHSVSSRARHVSSALSKFAYVNARITNLVANPPTGGEEPGPQPGPEVPPPAPAFDGRQVELIEDAPVHSQSKMHFDVTERGNFYHVDNPEELGTWTFSSNGQTGRVTAIPNYPRNDPPRDFNLTFDGPRTGTFVGTDINGDTVRGRFYLHY